MGMLNELRGETSDLSEDVNGETVRVKKDVEPTKRTRWIEGCRSWDGTHWKDSTLDRMRQKIESASWKMKSQENRMKTTKRRKNSRRGPVKRRLGHHRTC